MIWPLMQDNITKGDVGEVRDFLASEDIPRLTQGTQVSLFEQEFADWLGVKYALMVNSGASANLITIAALQLEGKAEILVPTLTWVSDITSVLHAGYTPVFVDIDPRTLGMDNEDIFRKITSYTRAVFITHVMGFNALSEGVVERLKALGIVVIEDCCEALGATQGSRKLGTLGLASNFSFYYAHHMSTIEGGMVCTNDEPLYRRLRQLRSHGLRRERGGVPLDPVEGLDPEFIFDMPAYNVRSTELNAVIGRSQLKRLDANNKRRSENLETWLSHLGPRYFTNFHTEGSCNYALTLVLKEPDSELMGKVLACLNANGVEYRRGTAGGGNQLRQPYLNKLFYGQHKNYPKTEHVHNFGLYVGNYPSLDKGKIISLCEKLNAL